MVICAVLNCRSESIRRSSQILFHDFPKDEKLRDEWLLRCGLSRNFDWASFNVCSLHFADEDYELSTGPTGVTTIVLKENSVPHLNLVVIKHEPPDTDEFEIASQQSHKSPVKRTLQDPQNIYDPESILESTTIDDPPIELIQRHSVIEPTARSSVITVQDSQASSTSSSSSSTLPSNHNWQGQYGFNVSFCYQDKSTKGVSWTYSKLKDKLYVDKDVSCPINFSTQQPMPEGTFIRVMALYSSPVHALKPVKRCYNHSKEEQDQNILHAEHLVRCDSRIASYEEDEKSSMLSVTVPFENPPYGEPHSTYIYKFACFGSCTGGPNRRPLFLVFTLERNGQVLGRRKIELKICACPGRDRKSEESVLDCFKEPCKPLKRKDSPSVSLSDVFGFTKGIQIPSMSKKRHLPNAKGEYSITTRDKSCYEFLMQMSAFYDNCQLLQGAKKPKKGTDFSMKQ